MWWTTLIAPISTLLQKIIGDKAQAAQAIAQLQLMAAQGQISEELTQLQSVTTNQSDVDKVEAASSSAFVAGWRPAVGWTCAAGLAIQFLVAPFATWFAALSGHPISFPAIDSATLMTLVLGMLGMGTLHSYDKVRGTETKSFH